MAGRGPAPKPADKRHGHRTTAEKATTEVPAPDVGSGPPALPEGQWSEATREWWQTWGESPQAAAFVGTDWQRLKMLLPLVDAYFEEPKKELLAEIRQSESLLGATVTDRLRARIELKKTPAATPVASALANRRLRVVDFGPGGAS